LVIQNFTSFGDFVIYLASFDSVVWEYEENYPCSWESPTSV